MRRAGSSILAIVLILGTTLGWPPYTSAQKTTLPPTIIKADMNPAAIRAQLRMAADLGRTALRGLQSTPTDDSVPLDEGVVQAARDTYVLIRAAREGMQLKLERQKIPDPVLELTFKRLTDAWNLSRTPVDKLSWSFSRQDYITMSVRDLSRALQLVDQALILLP